MNSQTKEWGHFWDPADDTLKYKLALELKHLREAALEELKTKDVKIYREIQQKDAGKNAIVVDPDNYMISLFEPNFSDQKDQQTAGYVGFTPA